MKSFQISRLRETDAASVEDCRDGELMERSAKWKKGSKAAGGGWGCGGMGGEEESASDWSAGAIRQVICSRLQ